MLRRWRDGAEVLEACGHRVVSTDLVDRGYGEVGRDFLAETQLPVGVTAIVTNPPMAGGCSSLLITPWN